MSSMKAWASETPGHENLTLVERPIPKPGPGQVLLKMKAASLNYRDTSVVKGAYPAPRLPEVVPCSDGCGEVVAIGSDVTRVQVGDRVAPLFFQDWISGPRRSEPSAPASTAACRNTCVWKKPGSPRSRPT